MKAIAYIDGSGNSARIQACAAIIHVDGKTYRRTRLLPPHTTNNVGEYSGLLLAIRLATELGVEALQIYSDSKLIVYQTRGEWKCKDDQLRQLRDMAHTAAAVFQEIRIDWVPREENREADSLCREAIKASETSSSNPFLQPRGFSTTS